MGGQHIIRTVASCLGAAILTTTGAIEAHAQTQAVVTIDRGAGFGRAASALGFDVELDAFEAQLEREIKALFGASDVGEFLRLSANAQSLANRGLGADYATNPEGLFFGFAIGAAVNAGDADVQDIEELDVPVSAGAQLALTGGYNFSAVGVRNLTVSAKALFFPLTVQQLDGRFANLGAHVQYKAFGPVGGALLKWGGIDLTAGFEWSRASLELTDQGYDADFQLDPSVTVNSTWAGRLELTQTAVSIPVELTSNFTLLSFLTLYAGGGITFQVGDATTDIELEAVSLTSTIEGEAIDLGRGTITVADERNADPTAYHLLVGLQLNLWKFHLFGQATALTRDAALGVSAGLRFAL